MRVKMRNGIRPYSFYRRVGKKRNLQTNQLPFDRSRYNSQCVCVCVCVPQANVCGKVVLFTLKHLAAPSQAPPMLLCGAEAA